MPGDVSAPAERSHMNSDEQAPGMTVLVDFSGQGGLKDVARRPEELAERSITAIDRAMGTIQEMARRVEATVTALAQRPQEVQVEFGLKLDAAAGALVARSGVEAHIVVTLHWKDDDERR